MNQSDIQAALAEIHNKLYMTILEVDTMMMVWPKGLKASLEEVNKDIDLLKRAITHGA